MTGTNLTCSPTPPPPTKLKLKSPQPLTKTPLDINDLYALLEADQDLWPQPVTKDQIVDWWEGSQEWSWKYVLDGPITTITGSANVVGTFFCIPLRSDAFLKLRTGLLKEHEIKREHVWKKPIGMIDDRQGTLFGGQDESCWEVGLHVFHVERDCERWRSEWGRMMARAFEDLQEVVERDGVRVLGYTALAVTHSGFRAFKNAGFGLFDIEVHQNHIPVGGVEEKQVSSAKCLDVSKVEFEQSNGYWFYRAGQGSPIL